MYSTYRKSIIVFGIAMHILGHRKHDVVGTGIMHCDVLD